MKKISCISIIVIAIIACVPYITVYEKPPRAEVETLGIHQRICGPLCKTYIEVTFKNNNNLEPAEGNFYFQLNRNSFIKTMWLKINGEWIEDITFYRATGKDIYEEIAYQKKRVARPLDPALLTMYDAGKFNLKVFPVKANDYSHVKLEAYTMLEGSDNFDFEWQINTNNYFYRVGGKERDKFDIIFTHELSKIADVHYSPAGLNTISDYLHPKKILSSSGLNIYYNFDTQFNNSSILDYFFSTDTALINNYKVFKLEVSDVATALTQIIANIETPVKICNNRLTCDTFFHNFVSYLIEHRNLTLSTSFDGFDWFSNQTESFFLNDKYAFLPISLTPSVEYKKSGINCNFISEFMEFYTDYLSTVESQIQRKRLTYNTIKLVPEQTEEVFSIINKHVARENEYIVHSKRFETLENPRVKFIAYDDPPVPIGGYGAIQENLIYPNQAIALGIEGTVILQVHVLKDGKIGSARILKSIHPILDLTAIETIRKTRFTPAYQRDKPIDVWINIPISFKLDSKIKKESENCINRKYTIHEKEFYLHATESFTDFIDIKYDSSQTTILKFNEKDTYDLMFKHAELIKYVYEFQNYNMRGLGIEIDSNSYYIHFPQTVSE